MIDSWMSRDMAYEGHVNGRIRLLESEVELGAAKLRKQLRGSNLPKLNPNLCGFLVVLRRSSCRLPFYMYETAAKSYHYITSIAFLNASINIMTFDMKFIIR